MLGLAGLTGVISSVVLSPGNASVGHSYGLVLRVLVPSVAALVVSLQLVLGAFFLSILSIRRADQLAIKLSEDTTHTKEARAAVHNGHVPETIMHIEQRLNNSLEHTALDAPSH